MELLYLRLQYRHSMETEQIIALLLAEMKAEMKADKEEMLDKMEGNRRSMEAKKFPSREEGRLN
jgi:hypothetical protein